VIDEIRFNDGLQHVNCVWFSPVFVSVLIRTENSLELAY